VVNAAWVSVLWYRAVIGLAGRLRHPEAALAAEEFQRGLELHYHSLGGTIDRRVVGDAGLQKQGRFRLAVSQGIVDLMAWLDAEQVHLPKTIDRYPTRALNRELYFWLTAFLAMDRPLAGEDSLPLGTRHLLRGVATSARVAKKFPALAERYRRLCAAELEQRTHALPGWSAESEHPVRTLETAIRYALGAELPPRDEWLVHALDAVRRGDSIPGVLPSRRNVYLPFLPVPLWGHPAVSAPGLKLPFLRRPKRRRAQGPRKRLARPRFDPAHQPQPVDGSGAAGRFVYPEWQYQRRAYRDDWCVVSEQIPAGNGRATFDVASVSLARRVRLQFEALRQLSGWNRRLDTGDELDLDSYVESAADARGCGNRSTRIYQERVRRWRDLSVAVLMDTSRSTEAWVGEHRVIGIARDSMLVLAEALAATGDDFGLFGFASDSRLHVTCYLVKDFDETYGAAARHRMLALKPGYYTRMGAAIRHVGARLEQRASVQKLLLVLTDGRPNDPSDGYEGQYGLEDTRRSLLELRIRGVRCFGLTIDQRGREYLPALFGAGHYAVFSAPQTLPLLLPRLYARITELAP
jgi:nitric oxide reductase NorD protein